MKSAVPSNVTALLSLPGTPLWGQVAPEHDPLLLFPDASLNTNAPGISSKFRLMTLVAPAGAVNSHMAATAPIYKNDLRAKLMVTCCRFACSQFLNCALT